MVAALFLTMALSGCLSGSPEACRGFIHEEPVLLVTLPDIYTEDRGWATIVQCNAEPRPISGYEFWLETPDERNITIAPQGTWETPTIFYAPTNDTDRGDRVETVDAYPGREGDPTYQIVFYDEDENGLFDDRDRIDVTYEAGATSPGFDSPLEVGLYWLTVMRVADEEVVGRVEFTVREHG